MARVKLIVGIVILSILLNSTYKIFRDGELPPLEDGYWGPKSGENDPEDTKLYPFEINIQDKILNELKLKLKQESESTRFVEPLEGIAFQYGFNTKFLKKVLGHWENTYDWKVREKMLNRYPQFKTKISGLDIHFQHVKNENNSNYKETFPLLIVHGWPGSFVELQRIIPMLTHPKNSDFNFELIIPSLPGYGFSDAAVRPGLGPIDMSRIFLRLMQRLGHDKFYAQGGDWGSLITTLMATRYPENVLALHSNMCMSMHPRHMLRTFISSLWPSMFMTPQEMTRIPSSGENLKFLIRETGYVHIQATKPDTIGVALSQSPSGLAAYILEKFSTWTNGDGIYAEDGLFESSGFTIDELLDNVMIYWVTNSITPSMRIYSEFFAPREFGLGLEKVPVRVPTACMQTRDPYVSQSRWIMQDKYPNIVRYTFSPKGGHFMAMEEPRLLADDVFQFVRDLLTHSKKN